MPYTLQTEWEPQEGYLPAITIHPPHSFLIVHGYGEGRKDIENRDWTTTYRGPLLIHVGQRVDEVLFDSQGNLLAEVYLKLVDSTKGAEIPTHKKDYKAKGIVGVVTLARVVTASRSPWFCGPYGFILENPRPFAVPVSFSGKPGLFSVPVSLLPEGVLS